MEIGNEAITGQTHTFVFG